MGKIADDMIEGNSCSLCGCYFAEKKNTDFLFTHGYPVACTDCWDEDCGYEKQDKRAIVL